MNPCQKPTGWLGRLTLWRMNVSHSRLTDWGLAHVAVETQHTILDVGCGGGRTIHKLATMAAAGKVYGLDYSEVSVAVAKKTNAPWIASGRVALRQGSVSQIPFPNNTFDLVPPWKRTIFGPTCRLARARSCAS
jgi:ubiquinone/menaquinone biosynthesis C-methylase UbiE